MASALKNTNYVAGWMGILSIVVVVVAIVASAVASGWHWGLNSISDLGIRSSSTIFILGLIVGGLLLLAYGAGRATYDRDLYRTGGICTAVAGFALVMMALFNLNMGNGYMHYCFAGATALFLALTIVIDSLQLWKDGGNKRLVAGFGIIVFIISIATLIAFTKAEWQTYTMIVTLIWFALDMGAYLFSGIGVKKEAA